jgi:hypothetical protein
LGLTKVRRPAARLGGSLGIGLSHLHARLTRWARLAWPLTRTASERAVRAQPTDQRSHAVLASVDMTAENGGSSRHDPPARLLGGTQLPADR